MVGRFERNKDLLQTAVESTATHVGRIATIITGAVVEITREIGDLVADGVEMREAAKKAEIDEGDLPEIDSPINPEDHPGRDFWAKREKN
ncbi:hypothetical protein [Williamsia herbipolensis]|uniref:hypothetical protein n=1 Tax=Williamsia herbipolensis TaxID=1603258 RepID=UPI0005F8102E|nr:hypothetical protein [Williamsia herbipolensis]